MSSAARPSVANLCIAMCSGVGTVCLGATLSESLEDQSLAPPFADSFRGRPRFSSDTFLGRFKSTFYAFNPAQMIGTDESFLEGAREIAKLKERFEAGEDIMKGVDEKENTRLWNLKMSVDSAVHPDTGEIVPLPFRMSGYVPFNGPICVAMVSSTSTAGLLFWNWVNQSQNALVNYFNRNASSPMSNETLAVSYGGAVAGALTVAFGLSTVIKKKYSPARAEQLLKFVAFPSSIIASSLNCYIVRRPEISTGVSVLDSNGSDLLPGSRSSVCAERGVMETTLSRAILQVPVYFIPPLLASTLPPCKRIISKSPALAVPITTYLLLCSFGFGLPLACAVFPQVSSVDPKDLEEKFQKEIERRGGSDAVFGKGGRAKFNRGL